MPGRCVSAEPGISLAVACKQTKIKSNSSGAREIWTLNLMVGTSWFPSFLHCYHSQVAPPGPRCWAYTRNHLGEPDVAPRLTQHCFGSLHPSKVRSWKLKYSISQLYTTGYTSFQDISRGFSQNFYLFLFVVVVLREQYSLWQGQIQVLHIQSKHFITWVIALF